KQLFYIFFAAICISGCKKIDRLPETEITDPNFWNTEADLISATNRLYQQLPGDWIDTRADDVVGQNTNLVSTGARGITATSGDWSDRYAEIFTSNNILEKGSKAKVTDAIRNRYFGEARFFRAYSYFKLLRAFGDVPLLLKTLNVNSPELKMGRTPRAEVVQQIYDDLDFAAQWLPKRADLPVAQYGRVTKSTAWALKAEWDCMKVPAANFMAMLPTGRII
ncbi:MAG TPA: RagB/SusD family nutrient uptake outer membrane protein, partial [Flavisolibacter sp.]|nr:RagB/SusD family nutrient uptake outer membrane protein [Flavisolibacter sp.]